MTVRIDQSPYFDDFDASKKFLKILFKPEVAVQVREMNQLQSIIKDQIQKFGNNIFKEGSIITGESSYDTNYSFVTVNIENYSNVVDFLSNIENTVIGESSGVEAIIDKFIKPELSDPSTFYLKYTKSSFNTPTFLVGERVLIKNSVGDTFAFAYITGKGVGSIFSTTASIYYVKGNFVYTEAQELIVSKYSPVIDGIIGFNINEYVVTFNEDVSLHDNAMGSPNLAAPGADRLVIDLILTKKTIETDFIEVAVFDNGNLKKLAKTTQYSTINDMIAKRSYDESGNYVVDDFSIQVRESLKDGNNKGLYSNGDESKVIVGIESGRGYVRGYEVENLSTTFIEIEKARETQLINNSTFNLTMGNYIVLSSLSNIPLLSTHETINFYSGSNKTGSILGTAKTRFVLKENEKFKLYVFDFKNSLNQTDSSFLANSVSCGNTRITGTLFDKILYETNTNSYLYPLPISNVKTLINNDVSDSSFLKLITHSDTLNGSGIAVISSLNSNSVFISQSLESCLFTLTDTNETINGSSLTTLSGVPVGSSITITAPQYANRPFIIQLQVAIQSATHKTKSINEFTLNNISISSSNISLGFTDVFDITNIVDNNGVNVINDFKLHHNRKSKFYDISFIEQISNRTIESISITGKRFIHSNTGDYFSVDSYNSIDYKEIPTEFINNKEVSLADIIDFRSVVNSSGNFSGGNSIILSTPVPLSLFRADINYYLPRIDKLYIDSSSSFNVIKGISSDIPSAPSDIDGTMALATFYIPAYTYNASDITINKINNRRYTMRDIGAIDERLTTVEKFIGLNDVEKQTADLNIIDTNTGLNRFKNGFVVDTFIDHSISEFRDVNFKSAIDPIEGKLLPEFHTNSFNIETITQDNVNVSKGIATLEYTEIEFAKQLESNSTTICNESPVFRFNGTLLIENNSDNWFSTLIEPDIASKENNSNNLEQTWRSWEINWLGFFDKNNIKDSKIINNRILSNNIVPYIRNNNIQISAKGLSPNSKLWCFFDNVDVSSSCKPYLGNYGDPIICDINGNVNFELQILDSVYQFRSGTKIISVCDNESNDKLTAMSYADELFNVSGLVNKQGLNSLSTRMSTKSELMTSTTWNNVIVQSIIVSDIGGLFVTSVDLYFKEKDQTNGVVIELREFKDGLPTDVVLAGSIVYKNQSEINTIGITNFKFDYPIFLQEAVEYGISIKTNSNKYVLYSADLTILEDSYISKQPYVSSLFKQQGKTWREYENSNIKFNLKKAKFVSSGSLNIKTKNNENDVLENAISTQAGSNTVTLKYKNHGYVVGQIFNIPQSSTITGNGIVVTGNYTISNVVDFDNFEFDVAQTANTTGLISGFISISKSSQIHTIEANFVNLTLPNTKLDYSLSGISSVSTNGTEISDIISEIGNIPNQQPVLLKAPIKVDMNNYIETNINLYTDNENISPVFDIYQSSIIGVQHKIDNSDFCKYITKVAITKNSNIGLTCFIDILNTSQSNIIVKYRVGNSDDEVYNNSFNILNRVTDNVISNEYITQEFSINDIDNFTHYQIMIIMNSTSNTKLAYCKNLKIISLGT